MTSTILSITVEPSGRQFQAQPHETLLAAGIRQGIGLPYGCKDGACGSCKCKLLSGRVVHGSHQSKALSAQEEALGYVLTCCGVAQTDVVIESPQVVAAGAFAVKKMPVRVRTVERVSPDVVVLRLQLPANEVFQYHAGQYVDFLLRDGQRRSYSMATAAHTQAEDAVLELHLRHMPGGKFTEQVFSSMKEKDILRIEGPHGSFYLRQDSDKPLIFLASGTGFAPIKAMIEDMQFKGIERPATLYWGVRQAGDLYAGAWIEAQLPRMPHLRYVPVLSEALPEDQWTQRRGLVHEAVLQDFPNLSAYQVYACGAPVVVEAARHDFTTLAGLPAEAFFADAFTSAADKKMPV